MGGKQATTDFSYFIISGKCNVVREMMLVKKFSNSGKARYSLPSIKDTKNGILAVQDHVNKKIERKLLIIRTLNEGDFFGVGEDLDKTYIITAERVSTHSQQQGWYWNKGWCVVAIVYSPFASGFSGSFSRTRHHIRAC